MKGFDDLSKQLEEAQKAAQALDGEIGTLRFNPADPQDVQRAIKEMERIVDARFAPCRSNPLVQPFADATKETFRKHILEQAREASGQGEGG